MDCSLVVDCPKEAEEQEEVLVEEREARPFPEVGPVDQEEMDLEEGATSGYCHQGLNQFSEQIMECQASPLHLQYK